MSGSQAAPTPKPRTDKPRRDEASAPSSPLHAERRNNDPRSRKDEASAPSSPAEHDLTSRLNNNDPAHRRDEASAPSSSEEGDLNSLLNSWDEERERGRRQRRPRLANFDYTGAETYHLVVVTHQRAPVLIDQVAIATANHLTRAAAATAFELLVYTIMPDHVHILAHGTDDDANAKRFIQRFKQLSSYAYRQRTGRQLWQQSFFDRILRKTDDVDALARYIIHNPFRAGLITAGEDWPHEGGTLVADGIGRS